MLIMASVEAVMIISKEMLSDISKILAENDSNRER